jgi:hypothetical protein
MQMNPRLDGGAAYFRAASFFMLFNPLLESIPFAEAHVKLGMMEGRLKLQNVD